MVSGLHGQPGSWSLVQPNVVLTASDTAHVHVPIHPRSIMERTVLIQITLKNFWLVMETVLAVLLVSLFVFMFIFCLFVYLFALVCLFYVCLFVGSYQSYIAGVF